MYTLNGIPLSNYGIIAGRAPDSNLAISGCWDMPERTGKTHHIWADDNGLEPYLRADELFYAGRDIVFHGHINGGDRSGALVKVNALVDGLGVAKTLVPFASSWGTWQVYVKNQVQVNYMRDGWSSIVLTLRQPVVSLTGTIPIAIGTGFGIDGIPFSELGLVKLETIDQFNIPQTKDSEVTSYGYEAHSINKRSFREFDLKFGIKQPSYTKFQGVIQGLNALFSKPGSRTLKLDDGSTREFFIKNGFKVGTVHKQGSEFIGVLTVRITEIRMLETWNKLTDKTGMTLVDKNGQPLTEIIKKF